MAKKVDPKLCDIPVEGSLGLLALGAVGILAWKKKQKETAYVVPHSNFIKKRPEELKAQDKKKTDPAEKENKKK